MSASGNFSSIINMAFISISGTSYGTNYRTGEEAGLDQLTAYGVALVPVLVGLSELLKRFGVPSRFIPLSAMLMGYFFAYYYLAQGDFKQALLLGTVLGLSAIGLFSGAKNTLAIRK